MRAPVAIGLSLAAIAVGCVGAQGSLSAQLKPTRVYADIVVEQKVADFQGGILYAGGGFAVSASDGLERLAPYAMWCKEQDLLLAFGEVCMELEAPLIGNGDYVNLYVNVVW